MERRKALTLLVHGGSASIAALVGIPTLIYAISPGTNRRSEQRWGSLGPLADFVPGTISAAVVQLPKDDRVSSPVKPGVYVWRVDQEEVIVFSRSCTDLGCPVTFDPGSECFFCPCHGGIFSKQGDPMAGPPDRPLYRYHTRLQNDELQIDLNSVPPMV